MTEIDAVTFLKESLKEISHHVEINGLQPPSPEWALAIAEAINFAPKHRQLQRDAESLYKRKSKCINAALALGCTGGWGKDCDAKEVFFLYTKEIGVASFHIEKRSDVCQNKSWNHGWCGIKRQRWAWPALESIELRKLMAEHIQPNSKTTNDMFQKLAKEVFGHWPYADIDN